MRRYSSPYFQKMFVCVAGLLMVLLIAGCAGVSNVGKQISSSPTASAGSSPTPGTNPGQSTPTPGAPAPGSISFTGQVQSVNASSITVLMPNGQSLTASIVNGQTDLEDFNGSLPPQNQAVQIEATANTDGSFIATKIKRPDPSEDPHTVDYVGVTTSTVGSDNVLHFRVGTMDESFTLSSTTTLSDFQNNARNIGNNQSIKVKVRFQGANANVLEVEINNPDE